MVSIAEFCHRLLQPDHVYRFAVGVQREDLVVLASVNENVGVHERELDLESASMRVIKLAIQLLDLHLLELRAVLQSRLHGSQRVSEFSLDSVQIVFLFLGHLSETSLHVGV